MSPYNENQLMHYLSAVYVINQPLHQVFILSNGCTIKYSNKILRFTLKLTLKLLRFSEAQMSLFLMMVV